MLAITLGGIGLSLWKGKFNKLPVKIRLALAFNIVMQISALYLQITTSNQKVGYTGVVFKKGTRIAMSFTCCLWVAIHWQFTAFYMQTACLLRKTLRARSDEELHRVKRTK